METFKMIAGDIVLDGQNNIEMVSGNDEVLQSLEEIFRVNVGEWFLNTEHGFDRFEVLGQKHERERIIERLYEAVLQEERIERVEGVDFNLNRAQRHLSINFKVILKNGEVIEGGVNV